MHCPLVMVSSALSFQMKKKATLQCGLRVVTDILLNQVRVYHERVSAANVVDKFWFFRSLSYQQHSNFSANIATENVSQVRNKKCKTRSVICTINLNFFVPRDTLTVIQL